MMANGEPWPDDNTWHVYPSGDVIDHDTDGSDCPCGTTTEVVPREDGSVGWLILHHSMDGREFAEPDYVGPPMRMEA